MTKKGTNARDFLNHFSKTAAQIIFTSASHFLQMYTDTIYNCFILNVCISVFVLVSADLTLDNSNSAKTQGTAAGPDHTLKGLWKAKTRMNGKRSQ